MLMRRYLFHLRAKFGRILPDPAASRISATASASRRTLSCAASSKGRLKQQTSRYTISLTRPSYHSSGRMRPDLKLARSLRSGTLLIARPQLFARRRAPPQFVEEIFEEGDVVL